MRAADGGKDRGRARSVPLVAAVLGAALAGYLILELRWAHWVSWDEIEFYRATLWTGEGRLPFRDFWEHHLPLQWIVFAPVARASATLPGMFPVLAMRVSQLPLWLITFAALVLLMRRAGMDGWQRAGAIAALILAPHFLESAIEYRLDTLGNAAWIAGVAFALVARPRSRALWAVSGLLFSASVLANLRMVYLVLATGALLVVVDPERKRWCWRPDALWMSAGVSVAATASFAWLGLTGSWGEFASAMRLNATVDAFLRAKAHTFLPVLLDPIAAFDPAALFLWAGGIAGTAAAVVQIRRPGTLQLLALFAILSVLSVALLGVHYAYHMQTTFLLLAPLSVSAIRGARPRFFLMACASAVLLFNIVRVSRPSAGAPLVYQNEVLEQVRARTSVGERVWDGCGFALDREPAYRYWFLPSIVRIAAQQGLIERYDARSMRMNPPAAIVHGVRVNMWLQQFPDLADYVTHHYVPLSRDLWVPGLTGRLDSRTHTLEWIVPRTGRYRAVVSDILPKHPWFRAPLRFGLMAGESAGIYEVELSQLPRVETSRFRVIVDGRPAGTGEVIMLHEGTVVTVTGAAGLEAGVLIVPADVSQIFSVPDLPLIM